jgi:hypothetical protein
MIVMLLGERKLDSYFCVDVKVIAGLKFWLDFGEIKYSDFDGGFVGFDKLVFFIYFSYFIYLHVFFRKLHRLKIFGVFTVFLVKEVSFFSPVLIIQFLLASIEFELTRSLLVLFLSVFYVKKENLLNYSGLIRWFTFVFKVRFKKSAEG